MNSKGELQELCQKRGCGLPEYCSVSSDGPSHSPLFVRQVTVVWENQTITQRGEGRSKRDADKVAANEMLQLLKADTVGKIPPSSCVVTNHVCVQREYDDVYSEPVASPTRFKVTLGELLQADHHPTPQYTVSSERGPPHRKEFTVKCTIVLGQKQVEQVGEGSTKKIAESNAAKNMLTFLQDGGGSTQVSGGPLFPHLFHSIPLQVSDGGSTQVSGGGSIQVSDGGSIQVSRHHLLKCSHMHLL